MLEDDFLKERQNIREKMLKYSRAINQGKPLDEEFKDEFSSDDILRRRFKNKKRLSLESFEETKDSKTSNIYLKEDLINVKLEEKQSLALKILSHLSKKKEKKKNEKIDKKTKKIFNFSLKKKNDKKILEKPHLKEIPKEEIEKKSNIFDKKNTTQKNDLKEKIIEKNEIKTQNLKKDSELKTDIKAKENITNLNIEKKDEHIKNINEDNEKTKNVLLEGFSAATKEDRNLNSNHLLFAILFVSFALFLFAPQIYIRNQIYYLSREIASLRAEESVLNEESKELKRKLENMRFQNQILDYLE